MPRLVTTQYVYSGPMDDSLNNYGSTTANAPAQQQHVPNIVPGNVNAISSKNYLTNIQETSVQDEQIHTISSSDEDISSEESADFEGFDDYNSSGFTYDSYGNVIGNRVTNFHDYQKEYENVVEVEDDDDEIAIDENNKIIYMSIEKVKSKNLEKYCDSHIPNKRTKYDFENSNKANTATLLKTIPDQIVEVNSDSTTNSLKQKRQQINNKFQLNFCQQNHKVSNNPNKYSSESTSEFPVSSPSNPQQPRGGKYPPRQLLKNTLPADSFERQLAMITICNPQMTLEEKIQYWDCEDELSDVEDVNKFDDEFKRVEKQKRLEIKQREKCGRLKITEIKNFDSFRQMILSNLKEQKNQKPNTSGQGGGTVSSAGKCIHTSESESSKSILRVDDRPSTSAVAQQQLQQRRSKAQLCLETGESKKRIVKEIPKRNQNSTTPPQTSSSDNERECFKKTKNNECQRQLHIQDTLICPSSSEEAASHDAPTQVPLKMKNKSAQLVLKNTCTKSSARPLITDTSAKTNEYNKLIKNSRILTDEEIDSVFRLHRLNRERDKYNHPPINEDEPSTSIIKMRLDFTNENKTEILMEKKQKLFKTPIVPQKYLAPTSITTEYKIPNKSLLAENVITNKNVESESLTKKSLLRTDDNLSYKVNSEMKSKVDDVDGVYHQQHEFCNYLGLTGMSTATAMANAVAELAQCNLARRSMRVQRQQQQERRDKSAKEKRLLENEKAKQLKEMHKKDKDDRNFTPDESIVAKSEEGSQVPEPTAFLKKTSKNSMTKSSTKSQNSSTTTKIKTNISRITPKKEEELENYPSKNIKDTPQPIREIIPNDNSHIEPEGIKIHKKENNDCVEEISLEGKENITRILRSSIQSTGKFPLKDRKSKSPIPEEVVQNPKIPIVHKVESVCDTELVTKIMNTNSTSLLLKTRHFSKDEKLNDNSKVEEVSIFNAGGHLIASTPNIIQQKIQMALEESRKSKPSIFIVQSLENRKENVNNLNMNCSILSKTADDEVNQRQDGINDSKESNICTNKFNKNNKIKAFRGRQCKKYPISKRQLRNRKLIVIKSLKRKRKCYAGVNAIKRNLRSTPKTDESHRQNSDVEENKSFEQKFLQQKLLECHEAKSYRTVHTETKDLETYLNNHKFQSKPRSKAKPTAPVLLEKSKRMPLRGSCNLINNKTKLTTTKIQRSKHNSHSTSTRITTYKLAANRASKRKTNRTPPKKSEQLGLTKQILAAKPTIEKTSTLLEIENVVVSSTTNTYDERSANDPLAPESPITLRLHNAAPYIMASSPIITKDQTTQCNITNGVHYLNTPLSPTQPMRNPLKSEHGDVLYIYLELDILIVIQERLISFWKCSKLVNILINKRKVATCTHRTIQNDESTLLKQTMMYNCCNNQLGEPSTSPTLIESNDCADWYHLGELRRSNFDCEIFVPYANRICLHNSTPIYLEMRGQQLPKNQRDCNLLSMYVNIYYYHDEDMIAKCNSIPLDSIQSDIKLVNYTTLRDSRYFIMTWPQENILGKTRSGLCKYSLTPQLDTLASIREFKSLRHTIHYLECMSDDKLIGFGETQVSIWDYRTGDLLMNFDFEIPMGRNLAAIYFPSQDIEQNNMLILHQFRESKINTTPPELITIACTVTHTQPSYRVLQQISLPMREYQIIKSAIKTGDHIVVTGHKEDELWISLTNPTIITTIPNLQNNKRFYSREKSQLIELTERTLNVNSVTNHILMLAAGLTLN